MNPVLHERYYQVCTQPSDVYEHLPTFVDAVLEADASHAGPVRVVELGVRYGVSTIAWLYGLEGRGHLWSVDCSFPVAAPGSDVNLLDSQGPLGVIPWWTFISGYDTWPAVLEALPKVDLDIVFIDTNHVYEETLVELNLYRGRVRAGGKIFLHDTAIETTGNATTPQPPFPVRTAMEEFCSVNNLRWDNNPDCSGLGTIYVP